MRTVFRTVALASALALAAGAAYAQKAAPGNGNPFARGEKNSFYFGSIEGPLNSHQAFGRPTPHVAPVTPVPEPSEWALMAAGLALVGYIVRRSSKRDD